MRLISCHVQNFGRLHDFKYDFEEGCNVISTHNGWGKSTLAAFIRIMFYGFEGESKRNALENERKRWSPWQGGVYGGSLTFDDGRSSFTVTRTLGNKVADDSFELRDAATNLIVGDYSERLGEELFGVNSESYMKTVYIGQNDVITSTTDGINAKIGNIADDTADLDCYERTSAYLNDLLTKNSAKRVTGSLYKLKNEIANLQVEVQNGDDITEAIEKTEKKIIETEEAIKLLGEYRDANLIGQKKASDYKDVQSILQVYDKLEKDYTDSQGILEEKRGAFPGDVPNEEDLAEYLEAATKAEKLKGQSEIQKVSDEDEQYLNRLRDKYKTGVVTDAQIKKMQQKWRERDAKLIEESQEEARIKVSKAELEAMADNVKLPAKAYGGIVFIVIGLIAAIATILLAPNMLYTYIGIAVGAILIAVGIGFTLLVAKKHRQAVDRLLRDEHHAIEEQERRLKEDIGKRVKLERSLEEFLTGLGIEYNPKTVVDELENIRNELASYEKLLVSEKNYYEICDEYEKADMVVVKFIKDLGLEPVDDRIMQINGLTASLKAYEEALKNAEQIAEKKTKYEKDNDIETLRKINLPETIPSLTKLTEEYNDMVIESERLSAQLKDSRQALETLYENKEIIEEKIANLEDYKLKLKKAEREYKNVELAAKYLTSAKESLTSRYMDPLMKEFEKYYSVITGKTAAGYKMDANINMTVEESGTQHDIALLSAGYRDLLGFCMRLALVDAMYENEKPVLVLDDPFVNFDNEKLEGVKKLLEMLKEQYQVIYFTCH